MNAYDLKDIERRRGDFDLRIGGSFRLQSGEIYAVAGPNGCGKSTLLNLLALLDRPQQGEVVFRGEPVAYERPEALLALRRRVGYLMQNPYLFKLSVFDNIAYGLRVRGRRKPAVRDRVRAVMDGLSLTHLAARPARELSGGEAQRVALARTLAPETEVLLLDEPTANVDRNQVHAVEEAILWMNRERNVTVVLATHSREQAYRMSRHLISIVDGRIRDIAYENVFPGTLSRGPDGVKAVTVRGGVRLRTAEGEPGRVTVSIDPREILLSREELVSSALNRLHGSITKIEDVNGSLRVFVDVGVALCAVITRTSYHKMGLNIGNRVWATFKANAVKVL